MKKKEKRSHLPLLLCAFIIFIVNQSMVIPQTQDAVWVYTQTARHGMLYIHICMCTDSIRSIQARRLLTAYNRITENNWIIRQIEKPKITATGLSGCGY
jgi:hypothetical protein